MGYHLTDCEVRNVVKLKEWSEYRRLFERMESMSCRPDDRKYPLDYIFDEEKSVKWNREEANRRNQEREEKVKELQCAKNKARDEVMEDIYFAIQQEVGGRIGRDGAMKIWAYAYEHGHACGWNDIQCCLNEVVELISGIVNRDR